MPTRTPSQKIACRSDLQGREVKRQVGSSTRMPPSSMLLFSPCLWTGGMRLFLGVRYPKLGPSQVKSGLPRFVLRLNRMLWRIQPGDLGASMRASPNLNCRGSSSWQGMAEGGSLSTTLHIMFMACSQFARAARCTSRRVLLSNNSKQVGNYWRAKQS